MSSPFHLSRLAASMRPSPIRELFKLTQQPGMISFAGGLPAPDAFPVEELAECAEVLARDGRQVLQYGASEGYGPLREVLLERMSAQLGGPVAGAELLVTSGSQQAADLVARCLLDPDDVVVVEAPTYPGTLHCLRNAGARFAAVPGDRDGMQVDRLPEVLQTCDETTGKLPKLIYTVPDFANPSGACLSLERRHQLLDVAARWGVPILEDDPYGRLRYGGEPLPTLKALSGGSPHVIYASSFSKILAPGVRVAWTVAARELTRAMVLMRQGEDLCTSTVTQALVAEYCRRDLVDRHTEHIIATYARRCRAMQAALSEHVAADAATWHEPAGGFFFWLQLASLSGSEAFHRAVDEGVAFVPGSAFYPSDDEQLGEPCSGEHHARLCFTFASPEEIDEGCRRLARALAR